MFSDRERLEEYVFVTLPNEIFGICGLVKKNIRLRWDTESNWKTLSLRIHRWLQIVDYLNEKDGYVENVLRKLNEDGLDRESFFNLVLSETKTMENPSLLVKVDGFGRKISFDFEGQVKVADEVIRVFK